MPETNNLVSLKPEVIIAIKKDFMVKHKLMYLFRCHSVTLDRWLKENNTKLTEAGALKIIADGLNRSTTDELLTDITIKSEE